MEYHDKGRTRRVCIIIDIESANDSRGTFERIDHLCNLFDAHTMLARLPLHWRFPAHLFDIERSAGEDRALARIRARIAAGTDMFVPAGYSGIDHRLLLPYDIEFDIRWCGYRAEASEYAAPRAETSTAQILIHPYQADSSRGSAIRCYEDSPFPICITYGDIGEILIDNRHAAPVAIVRFEDISGRCPEQRLRRAAATDDIFLFIDETSLHDPAKVRELTKLIQRITAGSYYRITRASQIIENAAHSVPEMRTAGIATPLPRREAHPLFPDIRYPLDEINRATQRARRDSPANQTADEVSRNARAFLNRIRKHPTTRPDSGIHRDRILVSDMTGDVVLAGEGMVAMYESGHLAEFQQNGVPARLATPSTSSLTVDGALIAFELESAFSFEEPGIRGLQQQLRAETNAFSEPVRLQIDTFFTDNAQYLFLATKTVFPEPKRDACIDLYPFDISFEIVSKEVVIASRYPDGEWTERRYTGTQKLDSLWGTAFEIDTTSYAFMVFCPELESVSIHALPVSIRRTRRGIVPTLHIGGVTRRLTSKTCGNTTITSLYGMDLLEPESRHVPVLPSEAADLLHAGYVE